jgi:hypothetical protein
MSLGWARLASGVEPGDTFAPTAAAHPGVHPSGRRGLFQLGRGKAGGTSAKPPVVFTLADHEQSPAQVQFWIEEVQRRAGGSLHRGHQSLARLGVAFDKATIADVQAGEASWPRSPPAPTTPSA